MGGIPKPDVYKRQFQPSDLILIAARPSMGKTAFVLNVAQHMAFKEGKTVAIFSLETSKEQLVNRLFSLESKVDSQALRTGNLTDEDWAKLIEGAAVVGKSNLIIDDTPGISIAELRSKCRKFKLCLLYTSYRVHPAEQGGKFPAFHRLRPELYRRRDWFRGLQPSDSDL